MAGLKVLKQRQNNATSRPLLLKRVIHQNKVKSISNIVLKFYLRSLIGLKALVMVATDLEFLKLAERPIILES